MYQLMTLKDINKGTQPPSTGTRLEYDLEADLPANANYDPTLKTMVQSCLSFKPKNRPNVDFLKDWVEQQMLADPTRHTASEGGNVFGGHLLHKMEMARAKINVKFVGALPGVMLNNGGGSNGR